MTEFGDTLAKAIDNKKNDINSFIWKLSSGKNIRMMDMDADTIQKSYDHAISMLYSDNKYTPGKLTIRKNINKIWRCCNAELLKRYIIYDTNVGITTNKDLLDYLSFAKKDFQANDSDNVSIIMNGVPSIFEKVTISELYDACFDKLGTFNKKMISDKFILSQGIWLTEDEKKDLTEYDSNGIIRKWFDVIKERLFLTNIRLRVDPKGLSYSEFRSLIQMDKMPKITSLSTATLTLLRDKILLRLDKDLNYHIDQWNDIINQLERVAKYKNIDLVTKNYAYSE